MIITNEIGKNPTRNRDHNRKIILDLLRQHGQLSRQELATYTLLSAPAVANVLEELQSQSLITQTGRKSVGRGQPSFLYQLNPQGAYTVGYELSPNGIVVVALDLAGQKVVTMRKASQSQATHNWLEVLAPIEEEIRQQVKGDLLGIGIVFPTPYGAGPTTLSESVIQLREQLSDNLQAPVWLENDANAAALSVSLFGCAATLQNIVVLYFGEGIGLGILYQGKLIPGSYGNAGEIGHIVVVENGLPCPCGQKGCLERYVSRHALSEALKIPLHHGEVQRLWSAQDKHLKQWIQHAGKTLAPIINMIENLFDPQTIILSGQFPAPVIDALIDAIPLRPSVASIGERMHPRLMRGDTGVYAAALGAATLPYYHCFTI